MQQSINIISELNFFKNLKEKIIVADLNLDSDYNLKDINIILVGSSKIERKLYKEINNQRIWTEYLTFKDVCNIFHAIDNQKATLKDLMTFAIFKSGLILKDENNYLKDKLLATKSNFEFFKTINKLNEQAVVNFFDMVSLLYQDEVKSAIQCSRLALNCILSSYFLINHINVLESDITIKYNWFRQEINDYYPTLLPLYDQVNFDPNIDFSTNYKKIQVLVDELDALFQ